MRHGRAKGPAQRFHPHGHSAGTDDALQDGPGPCWVPGIRVFEAKSAWGQPQTSLGGGELVVSRTLQTPEPGSASHFTDRRRDYSRQGSGSQGSGLLVHLDEFASSVAPARMLRRVEMVSPPPEGPSGEEAGGGVGEQLRGGAEGRPC